MTCKNQLDSQMLHFADDTNLLYISKSMKKINKDINLYLSLIVQWLRSQKICLNENKTELVIFSPNRKQITKHLNFRISGQKIEISNRVIGLVIIFTPGVIVIKMSKMAHFLYFLKTSTKDQSQFGENIQVHLKDLVQLFQEVMWIIEFWATSSKIHP